MRRVEDKVKFILFALCIVSAPLSIFLMAKMYGSLPDKMQVMSEATMEMRYEMSAVKRQQEQLMEANRVAQNWRDRLVTAEQKIDRHTDQIVATDKRLDVYEKRLDKLEDRPGLFGNSKK